MGSSADKLPNITIRGTPIPQEYSLCLCQIKLVFISKSNFGKGGFGDACHDAGSPFFPGVGGTLTDRAPKLRNDHTAGTTCIFTSCIPVPWDCLSGFTVRPVSDEVESRSSEESQKTYELPLQGTWRASSVG